MEVKLKIPQLLIHIALYYLYLKYSNTNHKIKLIYYLISKLCIFPCIFTVLFSPILKIVGIHWYCSLKDL